MQSTPVFTAPALPVLRTTRVLFIHDEREEVVAIADRLARDDHDVLLAESPEAAASRLRGPVDLVLVLGSMRTVERLRAAGALAQGCPVIALCEGEAEDRTRALQRGAVDAMTLPLYGPELSERVRLALPITSAVPQLEAIEIPGGLRIVPGSQEAEVHGQRVGLGRKEYEVLLTLAREPDRVFTKAELMREVWGYQDTATTRTLDSHACRLRLKLAEVGGQYVINKWGVGYRLLPLS